MQSTAARRAVITVLLGVALGGVILAGTRARTGDDAQPELTIPGIERLVPAEGTIIRRQEQMGVDLAVGFTGVLVIDPVGEIPEDQLTRNDPLNQVFYQAGEGKEIEEFAPGDQCVTAVFWPVTESRDVAQRQTWCFKIA